MNTMWQTTPFNYIMIFPEWMHSRQNLDHQI